MCYPPPPLTSESIPPLPSTRTTAFFVALYILSGVTQPLLMEVAAMAGLADKRCQLYMLFYYAGTMGVSAFARGDERLSWSTTAKTSFIAAIDIVAQTMNYSGATLAGPTIFAVVYSSVTVWCALFSRLMLGRRMSTQQWAAVLVVFVGLGVTGLATVDLGSDVVEGTLLVGVGSAMHAMMYVLSESLMNTESVSSAKFCGVYGTVACTAYLFWQVFYTSRHFGQLILEPMEISGTTVAMALAILLSISAISMLHSATFFHTVKYCPGGSTSAGVMKALQAVLVFGATSMAFCGRVGGSEMCFTEEKLVSLFIVVVGVIMFARATDIQTKKSQGISSGSAGYEDIVSEVEYERQFTV